MLKISNKWLCSGIPLLHGRSAHVGEYYILSYKEVGTKTKKNSNKTF